MVEWKKEDMDDRMPKDYQPKTQMPTQEARVPKWSMNSPACHCFITAEYDRRNESIRITVEDKIYVKDVSFTANEYINEITRQYMGPQKLVFLRRALTPNGLTPAPAFVEARKDRYHNEF